MTRRLDVSRIGVSISPNSSTCVEPTSFPNAFPIIGDDGKGTTFGNSGVGIVSGPGQANVDFSVIKKFALSVERMRLDFRAEAFNLLNKTNFAPPGTLSANSSGFGVFSASYPARQVQMALKLVF